MSRLRDQARSVDREIRVVCLVLRDPRVPWYCRAVAAGAIGYNLSPITLIPDWVPVIGFLDNFLVLGLGIRAIEKLAPGAVMRECRQRVAADGPGAPGPRLGRMAVVAALAVKVIVAFALSGLMLVVLRSVPRLAAL